ncbi:MAG: hypothetical protein RIC85_00945 [Gammaproteobacteria bacterium]
MNVPIHSGLKASSCTDTPVGIRIIVECPESGWWLSSAEPPNKALNRTRYSGPPSSGFAIFASGQAAVTRRLACRWAAATPI